MQHYGSMLRLRMGAIRYVHTRRFVAQLGTFATQFNEMRQVLAHMRDMAEGIVSEIKKRVSEGEALR